MDIESERILGLYLFRDLNQLLYLCVPYLMEYLKVFGIYIGYIVVLAIILIFIRFKTKVKDYIFRKLLHFVAFTSIIPLVMSTDMWWIAVAVEVLFLILVMLGLHFLERFSFYKGLFVEKAKHEVLLSFVALFGLMTALLIIFWGILGHEHLFIAIGAIMTWGPGDAVAGSLQGRNTQSANRRFVRRVYFALRG